MAKDFKNKIKTKDTSSITKTFFSNETLNNATEKQEEQKEKRVYTKFKSKENKNHTITIRLTDTEYNKLISQVEKSESGTITNYIMQLLKRGK